MPDWLKRAVFYQIYPQSFYDSNNDGIGDLKGILVKLDYIERLGINALWLNPCFESPFKDAGYDISDYYRVAARYGTNNDLKRLIDEVHQRGMKICLDLVPGHTSDQHPWFQASARPEHNEYTDRYIWTKNPWIGSDGEMKFITGYSDRMGAYAINFFSHQPALNYGFARPERDYQQGVDDPGPRATRLELKNIMKFWLDMGADGFRVDLAQSLIKKDPEARETRRLWKEIRTWLDREYQDKVLISEWGVPEMAIDGGFHIDFLLHFGVPGYRELFFNEEAVFYPEQKCYFDERAHGDFNTFWQSFFHQRSAIQGKGYMGIISSNHDVQRLACGPRQAADLKVIFTFLLTWPAVPFIYYGEEIGLRYIRDITSKEGGYHRTGSRTPMQWDKSPNAGFSRGRPEQLYLPLDPSPSRPDAASQEQDPDSLWRHVRNLITLRKNDPDLSPDSPIEILSREPRGYPLVYKRGHKIIIALNPGANEETCRLPLPGELDIIRQHGCSLEKTENGMMIHFKGKSWGVFRIL